MPETTKHVARQPSASSRFRTFGISRFDALQHATTYEYDRLYRQTKQTRVNLADDDPETNFEYDAVGNLTLLKDPKNNTTQWQYDGLDRVVLEHNVFDKDRRYDYDLVGNLTRVIDRNERKTTYAYDRLDRQTAETWYEDESSTTPLAPIGYHYDVLSRMFEVTDRDGDDQMASADYDYNYDAGDRVIMVNSVLAGLLNDVVDITFDQFHDLAGRRVQQKVSYNVTESLDYQNDYTRDQLGRLKQLTQQTGSGANEVAAKRVDFTYNLASQFDTITRLQHALRRLGRPRGQDAVHLRLRRPALGVLARSGGRHRSPGDRIRLRLRRGQPSDQLHQFRPSRCAGPSDCCVNICEVIHAVTC